MTLRELQRAFVGALVGDTDVASVLGDDRADAQTRLGVYRTMYRLRLVEVLAAIYPRTAEKLGTAWQDLATHYIYAHPSRSPSLRSYGEHLADVLRGEDAALAALEWARYDVFDAVDELVLTAERARVVIATVPLQRIAASALTSTHLVWREGITVYDRVVGAEESRMLAVLDGCTLAALCERVAGERSVDEAAQLIFGYLGRWVADGLLVDTATT
jgi:hypothetical protein